MPRTSKVEQPDSTTWQQKVRSLRRLTPGSPLRLPRLKEAYNQFSEALVAYNEEIYRIRYQTRTTLIPGCECAECRGIIKKMEPETATPILQPVKRLDFHNLVQRVTKQRLVFCSPCNQPMLESDALTDTAGHLGCLSCWEQANVCDADECDNRSLYTHGLRYMDGGRLCQECIDLRWTWCDECDEYVENDSEDHNHGACDCSPMVTAFTMPANSHGVLAQNERLLVELPEGQLSEEGIQAVISLLWNSQFYDAWNDACIKAGWNDEITAVSYSQMVETVESVEAVWQTKRGNYTRRLSQAFHEKHKVRLEAGLLSKVGSTLRAYSGKTNKWHIEFTRDFNTGGPEAFYNEDSCWWSSEAQSLCALKHWGGVGIRSYETSSTNRLRPQGRAWIQPLNEDLQPTQDTENAHAYIVYNGYGDLEGYTAARLVAYLASKTYRKVGLSIGSQYVNGGTGFLIADQDVCAATEEINISLDHHEKVAA